MGDGKAVTEIGPTLKRQRKARGWTLEKVATAAEISISTLSKIENAQISASFDTVVRVAHALELSFGELFSEPRSLNHAQGRRVHTRSSEGTRFETDQYDYSVHSSDLTQKGMIPLVMQVKATELPPPDAWSSHNGEEFIYVVRGRIIVHTELYGPLVLGEGDSCYIDSTMRHAFVRHPDCEEVPTMLSICMTESLFFGDVSI